MPKIKIKHLLLLIFPNIASIFGTYVITKSSFESQIVAEIKYLTKTNTIKCPINETNLFVNISDLCCDDEGNLYIADNGQDKIFKYNHIGQPIVRFGNRGQGPGEFLTDPDKNVLNISFGNDRNIYVFDTGMNRISIFSKEGKFIKRFSVPRMINDTPAVNERGEIFLVFNDGKNSIHCFSPSLVHKMSFFDTGMHFKSEYFNVKEISRGHISGSSLKKILTKNDQLIVLSNCSLWIYGLDKNYEISSRFKINQKKFLEDFKKRIKRLPGKSYFIDPFSIAMDGQENLYLVYFNESIRNWEVYKYSIGGLFQKLIRFKEKVGAPITVDREGNFYACQEKTSVWKFEN